MSQSNKKILTSGCGISWSQQQHRTWINVLQSLALNIEDVSGPAISNQTIVSRAFDHLLTHSDIATVIIQLTSIGKLDVEITDERKQFLVDPDPIRNFVHQGLWPSSFSMHHESKQSWQKWLYSPNLETQDLFHKLILLKNWCDCHHIQLIVTQGYQINWTAQQEKLLQNIVDTNVSIIQQYKTSQHYQHHNYTNNNTVPCIEFQIDLAGYFLKLLNIDQTEKIEKIKKFYLSKHQ